MNSLLKSANLKSACPAFFAICLTVLVAGSASCSCGASEPNDERSNERVVLRERGAGLWIENRRTDALEVLQPLVEVNSPEYIDLLNVGILKFALITPAENRDKDRLSQEAIELFTAAIQLNPDEPEPYYNLGVLYLREYSLELAESNLERALELAPDDIQTRLHYANALTDLDKWEEAEEQYRELVAVGIDEGKGLFVSAYYRLGQLLSWQGIQKGQKMMLETEKMREGGNDIPLDEPRRIGVLGMITWPRVSGMDVKLPKAGYEFAAAGIELPSELAGMTGLAAWTIEENWKRIDVAKKKDKEGEDGEDEEEDLYAPTQAPKATEVGLPDIGAWGPNGLVVALRQADGSYKTHTLITDAVRYARAFDFDEDGDLDILAVTESGIRLLRTDGVNSELTWVSATDTLPRLPSPPTDVQPVDFDHEGDIDLLVVGDFGARLWRNDGFSVSQQLDEEIARKKAIRAAEVNGDAAPELAPIEKPRWTDSTSEAQLPRDKSFDWCAIEDFDTDQDVDLLMGGSEGIYLADNLRGGVFADGTSELGAAAHLLANEPLIADLNGDAWPDIWIAGSDKFHLFIRLPSGTYVSAATGGGQPGKVSNLKQADLNFDGYLDATWTNELGGAGFALSVGAGSKSPANVTVQDGALVSLFDDFDGDGAMDVVSSYSDRAELRPGASAAGLNSVRLALVAESRDNRRGRGAIVELRAGPVYRRIFWTGEPITLGLGEETSADILRVTWPRGVEQHDFDVVEGSRWAMKRVQRLEGSCPFLYTWNGEKYEFVTDVLGITPLGLPMAPGMMVQPDHDEYVLVRGEQMKPRVGEDGKAYFDMQFTEELREVTYLDRLRLEVVDHPEGTEIFPNERFSFPPFPEAHTHVMRDPLVPLKATDHRGEDWSKQVASIDGNYAIPFEAHGGLLTGLAKPHTLELSFDPEQLADAKLLRLVCTGWFLWSDASINMAAARTPGVDFIPPILQVPDANAEGGWRAVGPPVGFPAGKRKTMVLDVTDFIDRDDPRIRIFGTLCIYWDAIRLATDNDDEPLVVTHVEPTSAKLWQRGFSRSSHPLPGHMLEWFDWDELDEPRWNQHPGNYTKLGEVLPLMTAIDDKYAIMGAGDALHARFPADNLPELKEGWRRDYLVFLDGWAKDRDPNTLEALYVEPLPFHGMSGYPYRADEAFPDDEEHRKWRREWNTRQSKRWIKELAPGRNPDVALW